MLAYLTETVNTITLIMMTNVLSMFQDFALRIATIIIVRKPFCHENYLTKIGSVLDATLNYIISKKLYCSRL